MRCCRVAINYLCPRVRATSSIAARSEFRLRNLIGAALNMAALIFIFLGTAVFATTDSLDYAAVINDVKIDLNSPINADVENQIARVRNADPRNLSNCFNTVARFY